MPRGVVAPVPFAAFGEKPAGAVFGFAGEQIGFVVAEHHMGAVGGAGGHYPCENRGRIGAAVGQIADKYQPPAGGMAAVVAVAQMIEQLGQGVKMAVDVADDVEFACRQGVGKHGMGKRKGFSGCLIARKNSLSGCLKGCAAGLGRFALGVVRKRYWLLCSVKAAAIPM